MRVILVFLLIINLYSSNIKKELSLTKNNISYMNKKLDLLVKEIQQKEKEIKKLNNKIENLNKEIKKLEIELKNSNQIINELKDLKKGELTKLSKIEDEINEFLSKNFYINSKVIDNINDLVNFYLTKEVLKRYSLKIDKLITSKNKIENDINQISLKIENILKKQNLLKEKKANLQSLLKTRKKEMLNLKTKKKIYKEKLAQMIKKAKNLQNKLKQLSIIKEQKKYAPTPNYVFRGIKTIPPLRGKVIKQFGPYVDPIYKIKIFNSSITIKPYSKNAIVRNIMPGQVVYIGENNNKKIVVVKHKGKFFSIYANLSKVSPILKKGHYIKRGTIIGRVDNTLELEITYKDKPINPLKVISLK